APRLARGRRRRERPGPCGRRRCAPPRRLHARHTGTLGFEGGQRGVLVVEPHRFFVPRFPRRLAFFQPVMVPPATLLPLLGEEALRFFGRLQAVLARLTPAASGYTQQAWCHGRWPVIPRLNAGDDWPISVKAPGPTPRPYRVR